jgi:hypothetical protein
LFTAISMSVLLCALRVLSVISVDLIPPDLPSSS